MNLIYLSSIDKYLSDNGKLYSDEELDHLYQQEKDWKEARPIHTFYELMEIFPEAIKPARKGLKAKIKTLKEKIVSINEQQEQYQENVINKAHFSLQNELRKSSEHDFDQTRKREESRIKTCLFQLSHLDQLEGKEVKTTFGGVDEKDIAQARLVPIEGFYTDKLKKTGKRATGNCPFHSENTGSFTIYLGQNSFYCYGCNFGGGVIDYIMCQHNIDFLSAVKKLLHD